LIELLLVTRRLPPRNKKEELLDDYHGEDEAPHLISISLHRKWNKPRFVVPDVFLAAIPIIYLSFFLLTLLLFYDLSFDFNLI
jgi:hypothetical protein